MLCAGCVSALVYHTWSRQSRQRVSLPGDVGQLGQIGNAFEHWREEGGASLVIRNAFGVFSALGSLQTVATNHDGGTTSFTVCAVNSIGMDKVLP